MNATMLAVNSDRLNENITRLAKGKQPSGNIRRLACNPEVIVVTDV